MLISEVGWLVMVMCIVVISGQGVYLLTLYLCVQTSIHHCAAAGFGVAFSATNWSETHPLTIEFCHELSFTSPVPLCLCCIRLYRGTHGREDSWFHIPPSTGSFHTHTYSVFLFPAPPAHMVTIRVHEMLTLLTHSMLE